MRRARLDGSRGGVRVARALGVPIYVHFSWLVVFGLVTWTLAAGYFPSAHPGLGPAAYWVKALAASLLFFACILVHELAHTAVALRHGVPIRSVTLFVFGGVAEMERDPGDGPTELKIAVAGPLASLALAGGFAVLGRAAPLGDAGRAVAGYLALVNLALAVFNLVPAFPLDGGRILRGFLWRRRGKLEATRLAATAGSAFAYLLIASGVFRLLVGQAVAGVWQVLIGWFLKEAAGGARRGAEIDDALEGLAVRDAMITGAATLPSSVSLAEAGREHFARTGYGGYPVVRDGRVVGLLCLRDLLRHPLEERETTSVQAAMSPLGGEVVIAPDQPLRASLRKMSETGATRLLVMEEGRLVGYLTLGTLMRHLQVRERLSS